MRVSSVHAGDYIGDVYEYVCDYVCELCMCCERSKQLLDTHYSHTYTVS